jgi:hypothetical protein
MNTRIKLVLAALLPFSALSLSIVMAGDSSEEIIAYAESAAPGHISNDATIIGSDGTVLRKGTNGWTCMPNTMPNDDAPMCNDAIWMELLSAIGSKGEFKARGIGVSYMLKGDYGSGVSNSDPYHPDPKSADDYVETGPHLMIVVPSELLEGITDDPKTGGPYVMWKDTPYVHLMVPVSAD